MAAEEKEQFFEDTELCCVVQVVLPTPRGCSLQVRSALTAFATHLPVCLLTSLEGQPDPLRHLKTKRECPRHFAMFMFICNPGDEFMKVQFLSGFWV